MCLQSLAPMTFLCQQLHLRPFGMGGWMFQTAASGGEQERRDAASMKRARAAQLGMLPKAPSIPGLEIHTFYEACDALGGDFYDFIALSPYELGIVMGDVSGHGIDAALLMAAAKKCIHIRSEGRSSPRETLLVAVEDLAHDIPSSSFISIFYGIIDFRSGTLKFASAGHTPPVLANVARRPVVMELRSRGVVFNPSVLSRLAEELSEETVPLKRGDMLVLYTDGLSESMNAAREQYGEQRLMELLKRFADAPAEIAGQAVLSDVERFRAGVPRADDQTQIVLRYLDVQVPDVSAPEPAGAQAASNLGLDRSSFIGRARELADLAKLIEQRGKLVTLTGAAGIGKSRLALAACRKLLSSYQGNAWILDLAEVQQPREALARFAQILGVREAAGAELSDAIVSALRHRQPLLLILDNLEHMAKQGADLVRQWLDAVPELTILATSRVLLGVPGEREFKLGPLSLEESKGAPSEAMALFLERAHEIRPDFKAEGKTLEIVRAICAGVDGIPLAVEFAAARLRVATIEQVLAQLRKPPPGATARPVDAQSRRQSMFDAVAWSYSLLSDWEKAAFEQLCVFRGGFFLEEAEAILDLEKLSNGADPLAAVSSLYDKNLLYGVDTAFGRQFHMYVAIRDFGQEQAAAHMSAAQRDELLVRHAEYFGNSGFLEFQRRYGRDAIDALDLIGVQRENLMATLDAAPALGLNERAAQAALALGWYLLERGTAREAATVTERAVKLKVSPTAQQRLMLLHLQARLFHSVDPLLVRDSDTLVEQVAYGKDSLLFAEALCQRASIHRRRADVDAALVDFERAEDAAKEAGAVAMPTILNEWARLQHLQARHDEAVATLKRAEAASREQGNVLMLIRVRMMRISILCETGPVTEALKLVDDTDTLARQVRSTAVNAALLSNRGLIYRQMGRLQEALDCHHRALETYKSMGDIGGLGNEAGHRANIFLLSGQPARALECSEIAANLARQQNNQQNIAIFEYISARALYKLGRITEALVLVERSIEMWHRLSAKAFWSLQTPLKALCLVRLGKPDKARECMQAVLPEIGPTLSKDDAPDFLCCVAMAAIERAEGNFDLARAATARARDIATRKGFSASSGQLVVNTAWGDYEELNAAYPPLAPPAPAPPPPQPEVVAAPRVANKVPTAPIPARAGGRVPSGAAHTGPGQFRPAEKPGPVTVKCNKCGRVMIGPLRKFENKRACNHCHARPFVFTLV